jgi:hypothetical protein
MNGHRTAGRRLAGARLTATPGNDGNARLTQPLNGQVVAMVPYEGDDHRDDPGGGTRVALVWSWLGTGIGILLVSACCCGIGAAAGWEPRGRCLLKLGRMIVRKGNQSQGHRWRGLRDRRDDVWLSRRRVTE